MVIIATILDVFLLIFVTYTFINTDIPSSGSFKYVVLALFAAPVSNLVALFMKNDDGLFRLYFKRKALEEKKKIQDLEARNTIDTSV